MSQQDRPPTTYCSKFEIGETYTCSVDRRGTYEKTGSKYIQLSFTPANTDGINQGTIWFNPPGEEKHQANEWAFVDAVSPIGDGQTFTAVRKGKPWYWTINGQSLEEAAPQAPQATQATAQPPVAAQRPSGAYNGPWMKDVEALREACMDTMLHKYSKGDYSDDFIHGQAACLFIAMDRHGASRDFLKYKALHLIGSKPADGSESEDGMPF
ncbi:MAG: hypothetical protein O2783_08175 [Chloroflexi bacterium]|nr:hypothetical protein [Chloroflexota bacterium]